MSKEIVHGRPSTYNNHKCRCEECTTAWANYIREKGYVRKHQAKKRLEKAQVSGAAEPILFEALDFRDENTKRSFLEALRTQGIPIT
jgi:hypothetical protein